MKIAILNDTHADFGGTNRQFSQKFIRYQERFYYEIFFPFCQKEGITKVLHLGDYYHNRKRINYDALNANRKMFLEPLEKHGMSMDIILGNHDIMYNEISTINSLKELLGFYYRSVTIFMKPAVIQYDGFPIQLIPWINDETRQEALNAISSHKANVLAGHFDIKNFLYSKGVYSDVGLTENLFEGYDMVLSGHYHTKSSRKNIHFLGSQFQMTWADAEDEKFFHVLDTETGVLTPVPIPLTLYRKIYLEGSNTFPQQKDLDVFAENFVRIFIPLEQSSKEKFSSSTGFNSEVDNLVSSLYDVGAYDVAVHEIGTTSVIPLEEGEESSGATYSWSSTKDLVQQYMENYTPSKPYLDKSRLMNAVMKIYTEAETLHVDL